MFFSEKMTRGIFYMLAFLVVAGVLASLTFFSWEPHLFGFFLLLEYSILFLSLLCFRVNSANLKYYLSQGLIAIPCFALLFIKKFNSNAGVGLEDTFVYLGIAYFGVLSLVLFFCWLNYLTKPTAKKKKKELFLPRIVDREKIIHYLDCFNIVGVTAEWGDGKTFLFKNLESKFKDKYHFVRIGVLSTTCDSIEKIVVSEIHGALRKEGIFSVATAKWNDFLSQSFLQKVGGFFKFDSFTEIVKQLLDDVSKLEKPILISFEDIDRNQTSDVLFKMFAVVDAISCDKIKVLYQYDESKLLALLGVEKYDDYEKKLYIEKYIPHSISLQKIPLYHIIASLLESGNYKQLKLEDFDLLKEKEVEIENLFHGNGPESKNRRSFKVELSFKNVSVRRVELFLEEINSVLAVGHGNRRAAIGLFIVKFFMPKFYDKLKIDLSLKKIPLFKDGKDLSTMLSDDGSNKLVFEEKNGVIKIDSICFYVYDVGKYTDFLNAQAFLFFQLVGYDLNEVICQNLGYLGPQENSKLLEISKRNDSVQRTVRYWIGLDFKLDENNQEMLYWLRKKFFRKSFDLQKKAFEELIRAFPPKNNEIPFEDIYSKLTWCECTFEELKELFDFAKSYYHGEIAPLLNQIDSGILQKNDSFCAYVLNTVVKAFHKESLYMEHSYWCLVYAVFGVVGTKYGIDLPYDNSINEIDSAQAQLAESAMVELSWFGKVFLWISKNPSAANKECIVEFLQQALNSLQSSK